jgi:hypothetical protein
MIRPTTSKLSAAPRLYSLLVALALILASAARSSSGRSDTLTVDRLYLLSATPTNYGDETFPATLYGADAEQKLRVIRRIVAQNHGVYSVQQVRGVIFVAYPHITPTAVSIIHTDHPAEADEVVFNPDARVSMENREGLSEATLGSARELFPLVDPTKPGAGTIIAVSGVQEGSGKRVLTGKWSDYANFRTEGNTGGPIPPVGPFGSLVDGKIAISIFGHSVAVETTPPFIHEFTRGGIVWLMAVNAEYSVLSFAGPASALQVKPTDRRMELAVHDRVKDKWKKIQVEGNRSRLRLFGKWLSAIVGFESPGIEPTAAREAERKWGTAEIPNVRQEYDNVVRGEYWLQGILTLENLSDGRKVRIETGQEDSEILQVEGDIVLYRVNDTIYRARIAGDQLKDTTVLVRDEDVPEIHWAFWSK